MCVCECVCACVCACACACVCEGRGECGEGMEKGEVLLIDEQSSLVGGV